MSDYKALKKANFRSLLTFVLFGAVILALLVMADRFDWLKPHPATGTAKALSTASTVPLAPTK